MKQKTVLILGAGVGGLHCALRLASQAGHWPDLRIVLVDAEPYHMLHSTLYHAVTADLKRDRFCLPISAVVGHHAIEFRQDIVERIEPMRQKVTLHNGGSLDYDYLVLGLGSRPNDFGIPGISSHAHFFGTFRDALRLRKSLLHLLKVRQRVRIVIGGGGLAGVELAGALASYWRHARLSLSIVEMAPSLLPGVANSIAGKAAAVLKRHRVNLHFGQGIKKVTANEVQLQNGKTLPYDIFVWTGGVRPVPVIGEAGFMYDERGRIIVRKTLQARGFARVFAVGDIASFTEGDQQLPQVTPHALEEGMVAADNIVRMIQDRPLRQYQPDQPPTIITLGHLTGFYLAGRHAWSGRWVLLVRAWKEWWYVMRLLPLSRRWLPTEETKQAAR